MSAAPAARSSSKIPRHFFSVSLSLGSRAGDGEYAAVGEYVLSPSGEYVAGEVGL